jgi:hypothetical protein
MDISITKNGRTMKDDPTYLNGEPVREGDLVRIGEWEGVVEFIITCDSAGWADYWHEQGEGVILTGPAFGRLHTKFHDEDLVLVGRKKP